MSFPENAAWPVWARMQAAHDGLLALRFAFSLQRVVTSIRFPAPLRAERSTHPDAKTASGAA
jgi:hypothetical protein